MNGEILPGWNIYASAFLSDPIISKSNDLPVGDTLRNSPRQGVSLWTTYEIQRGDYKGLGFGFGLFYVDERETQVPNNFVLPSYVRADASLFYRHENWDVQLNFKNLFETRYYELGSYTAFAGEPFSVRGTFSIRF